MRPNSQFGREPAEHSTEARCAEVFRRLLFHGPAAGRQGGGPLVRLERHPRRRGFPAALVDDDDAELGLALASSVSVVACVNTAELFIFR